MSSHVTMSRPDESRAYELGEGTFVCRFGTISVFNYPNHTSVFTIKCSKHIHLASAAVWLASAELPGSSATAQLYSVSVSYVISVHQFASSCPH